jgi:uncharacterized protein YbaR (Trm112 family)
MRADYSERNLKALQEWAGELACPACFGALRLGTTTVVCAACGRVYPVVDGIPVLIAERAETGSESAE